VENWAFIPPNVLGYRRLLGLKVDAGGNWRTNEKYSVPKYLLDGPLVAEDVYFGGAYRTVMLGSLGRAGAGMYALDITDPSIPKFLWALENNYYDQATMAVRPVDDGPSSGGPRPAPGDIRLSTVAASDSSALGRLRLTVSTPFIGTVDINKPFGDDVFNEMGFPVRRGAQYAYSDTDTDGGKAVYVIDMENGARIKELDPCRSRDGCCASLHRNRTPSAPDKNLIPRGSLRGRFSRETHSAASTDNWTLQRVFTPGTVTPSTVVGISLRR
jgi:type IV pilus assembly protein PilY1